MVEQPARHGADDIVGAPRPRRRRVSAHRAVGHRQSAHEVAAFVAGRDRDFAPRPIEIVEGRDRKQISFNVSFPAHVRAALDAGQKMWEPLTKTFKEIIARNHSTLFFTNSRRLAERITLKINDADATTTRLRAPWLVVARDTHRGGDAPQVRRTARDRGNQLARDGHRHRQPRRSGIDSIAAVDCFGVAARRPRRAPCRRRQPRYVVSHARAGLRRSGGAGRRHRDARPRTAGVHRQSARRTGADHRVDVGQSGVARRRPVLGAATKPLVSLPAARALRTRRGNARGTLFGFATARSQAGSYSTASIARFTRQRARCTRSTTRAARFPIAATTTCGTPTRTR